MRKWLSTLMIATFVMATTLSSYSHAMPSEHAAKTAASEHADCHGHSKASYQKNPAKNQKDDSDHSCCKKGMCKCANNGCHAKLLGEENFAFLTAMGQEKDFGDSPTHLSSAILEGIKRPPRA
jgi:hypothetical protein